MSRTSLICAIAILSLGLSAMAHAGDEPHEVDLLREIREMMERLARAERYPEGFVDAPDPKTCSDWCRFVGTIRVGDSPFAGLRLGLFWVSKKTCVTSRVESVTTSSDGSFSFPRVPLGEYLLTGSEDGRVVWEHPDSIVLNRRGEGRLDFTLYAGRLAVTVLAQDLKPVAGVRVDREDWSGEFPSLVEPEVTDSAGRATLRFVSSGFKSVRASIGDVSSYMHLESGSEVGDIRIVLPPFGIVNVFVRGWSEKSVGSVALTRSKDSESSQDSDSERKRVGRSLNSVGRASLHCSPGRWVFSLQVLSHSSASQTKTQTIDVRAGEAISVELDSPPGR